MIEMLKVKTRNNNQTRNKSGWNGVVIVEKEVRVFRKGASRVVMNATHNSQEKLKQKIIKSWVSRGWVKRKQTDTHIVIIKD